MSDKKKLEIVEGSADKPFETLFKEWAVANSQVMIEDGKTYLKYDALANLYARLIGPVPGTTVTVGDKYIYAQTTIGGAAVYEIADASVEVAAATAQTMALLRLFRQVLGPHLLDLGYEPISAAEYVQAKKSVARRPDVKTSAPTQAYIPTSKPAYLPKGKSAYKPRPSGDRWAELEGCISSQQQKVLFARAKDNGTLDEVKAEIKAANGKDFNEIPIEDFEHYLAIAGDRR